MRFVARLAKYLLFVVSANFPGRIVFPFFVVAGASLYCAISFKICSLFLRASNKAVSFSLAIWETKPLVAEFVAVLDLGVVVACVVVVAGDGGGAAAVVVGDDDDGS